MIREARFYAALFVSVFVAVALAPAAVLAVLAFALYPPGYGCEDDEPEDTPGPEGEELHMDPATAAWIDSLLREHKSPAQRH
jgi:hypothetical protein